MKTMDDVLKLAQMAMDNDIEIKFKSTSTGYMSGQIVLNKEMSPDIMHSRLVEGLNYHGVYPYEQNYQVLKEFVSSGGYKNIFDGK